MAYVVGSVSVEVVPDFRNAQNAITAWFKSQPDSLKIPVKPEFDTRSNEVEQQAAKLGTRVSKAMNDAAARNQSAADKLALQMAEGAEKSKLKAHAEAIRIHAQLERDRLKQEKETADLGEAIAAGRDKARLQAHVEAIRINLAMDRREAQTLAQAHAEAIRINAKMDREAAQSFQRAHAEAIRINLDMDREAAQSFQRAHAEAIRINLAMDRDASRQRQQIIKDEQNELLNIQKGFLSRIQRAMADRKAKIQIEIDERNALKGSRQVGGKIARAVKEEINQNAGIIAAAIGAALAFGAPVALAGAVALFAGIGAVAAAQSERVKSAWLGTWQGIRDGAISDAAVLVPVFERMSVQITQSFQRMRPALRDAFEAVGPQLESFTGALTRAAENALPGLVRAVQAGGPVIQGLGNFLEDVGTGISDFFDIIATHAPAAGNVFARLGDTMGILLPTLAELLGQGAELASTVLPLLNGSLGVLLAVLQKVGPILPTIAGGFLAFRVAQGAGKYLTTFAAELALSAQQGGLFSTQIGRAGTALSAIGRALPVVGIAAAGLGALFAESQSQIDGWTQALNEGGQAAALARVSMDQYDQTINGLQTGFAGAFLGATGLGEAIGFVADDTDQAKAANERWLASLTPVESAQRDLNIATEALAQGLKDENTSAAELAGLQAAVARAASNLAAKQNELELATRGVTEAMAEQIEQSRAQVDSAFAYQTALNDAEDAQAAYNDAVAEFGAGSEEAARAALDLAIAYRDVGAAASDKAIEALPAAMDDQQKAIIGARAELDYYYSLLAAGVDLPPELDEHVAYLENVVTDSAEAASAQGALIAALAEVGITAEAIPDSKSVKVQALTDEARTSLEGLGFKVRELPDGSFEIIAATDEAENSMSRVAIELGRLDGTTATPAVDLDDKALRVKAEGALKSLALLGAQRATPAMDADDKALKVKQAGALNMLRILAAQRPTPPLDADDKALKVKQAGALNMLRSFAALRPKPPLDANDGPVRSKTAGASGVLAAFGRLSPTPQLNAKDNASGIVRGIIGLINSVPASRSSTITVTTVNRVVNEIISLVPKSTFGATGGAIEAGVIGYDDGGAVFGRGVTGTDMVPAAGPLPGVQYRLDNGEHILTANDVARMGGQAGVYAFREMLSSGKLGGNFDVRQMAAAAGGGTRQAAGSSSTRDVTILTSDNPKAIIRAMRAEEQQRAALAPAW